MRQAAEVLNSLAGKWALGVHARVFRRRRAAAGSAAYPSRAIVSFPIEDHALIGDTRTAALVDTSGSVAWWCVPRFDSSACFAALLGDRTHGRWLIAPVAG